MKKLALFVLFFLAAFVAKAQSTTPNLSLQLPAYQQQNWQVPINYDFSQLDLVLGGIQNLSTGSTPTISISGNYLTGNTAATNILNLVGGYPGQTVRLICGASDTFSSIASGTNFSLPAPWSCSSSHTISFILNGTVWTEIGVASGTAINPSSINGYYYATASTAAAVNSALAACAALNLDCDISVPPGTISVSGSSPIIQLPITTKTARCRIHGAAWGSGGGTTLNDTGSTVFDLTSGTGPIFDQTITNATYQNVVGCELDDITLEDDPANASTNVTLLRFGGTMGSTFHHVSFMGKGSAGEICLNPKNVTGIFTERAKYDIWINNCTAGLKPTGVSGSTDFTHMLPSTIYSNEFANQNLIEASEASMADSVFFLDGNFSGAGGNVWKNDDTASGISNGIISNTIEQDGTATRYNNSIGGGFSPVLFNLGTGTWSDSGSINSNQIFSPATLNVTNMSVTGAGGLTVGSGSAITGSGPGGTIVAAPNTQANFSSAPTISSGFGTSPSIPNNNGTLVFTINVGTGGTATSGVVGLPTAAHGWDVNCKDITTASASVFLTKQTASSTTTATIGNFNTSGVATAWGASDILSCSAHAY